MKVASIVGARPQFIKLAPLVKAIQKHNKSNPSPKIQHLIIHTGQHYDYELDKAFFDELGIPKPEYNLEVGSGSHGWQTGEMIKRTEEVLIKEKPNLVLVYGDTNSTLAGAMAATKLYIPLAHVEAGLRSYNKKMPEEINRIMTDHCSNVLFCPTEKAVENLLREGFTNIVNEGHLIVEDFNQSLINNHLPFVINVGDIMYDALLQTLEIAEKKSNILEILNLKRNEYYLLTIHRAENTDNKYRLDNILKACIEIGKQKPVIFPIHPRTRKILQTFEVPLCTLDQLHLINPVSYLDMLILEKNASKILTDSGGVQKEAYLLGVPCITLRHETEWPESLRGRWNVLVDADKDRIINIANNSLLPTTKRSRIVYGDGRTAYRVTSTLACL